MGPPLARGGSPRRTPRDRAWGLPPRTGAGSRDRGPWWFFPWCWGGSRGSRVMRIWGVTTEQLWGGARGEREGLETKAAKLFPGGGG